MTMKTNRVLTLIIMTLCMGYAWAQGPNNSGTYYQSANGKKGAALKTALYNIINPHTNIGYDGLYEGYKKTDTRADGYVRDWYSNTTNFRHNVDNKGSYSGEGDMYNREHSVPQSWFSGNVIKADIVHVIPTDGYVNNRRSNYPLAEVNNITYQSNNGYSKLGSCKTAGYSGTVFEPNDEIKGDMARMYMYMVTCYEDVCASWGHDVFSSSNLGFESWYLDMLMRWAQQDPIDDIEIARNNAVYEVQGNRNPFVDYPGLEDYIWGSKTDQQFFYDNYEGGESTYVAMPMFTPDAGTYYQQVEVTLATSTEGAEIYYTTDGADASEQSIHYDGPFTLTETSTIKAVAIKEGNRSSQATARYVITNQDPEQPIEGMIALNNALFGTTYSGSINKSEGDDLVGTQNGVTVNYSLATGQNRYCNDEQIRLYPGNTLTVSVQQSSITELQFQFASTPNSTAIAVDDTQLVDGLWTGDKQSVTVTFAGSGHSRLTGVAVKVKDTETGITRPTAVTGKRVIYNLQGQRVMNPTHGIYIVDGKKVLIP